MKKFDPKTLKVFHSVQQRRFAASLPDNSQAEIVYMKLAERGYMLIHTGVPERWRGKGVAAELVRQTLNMIRAEKKKFLPICPYIIAFLQKHHEWDDLIEGKGEPTFKRRYV